MGTIGYLVRYYEGDYNGFSGMTPNEVTFNNNLYYPTGSATKYYAGSDFYDANSIDGNPNLSGFAPTASSSLVVNNAATISGDPITYDYNETPRSGSSNDIGAVEYSN